MEVIKVDEEVDEIERTLVDVAKEEDDIGCIEVVGVMEDGVENELGATLELV